MEIPHPLILLAAATGASGLAGMVLARLRPVGPPREPGGALVRALASARVQDACLAALLVVWGMAESWRLQAWGNPTWIPYGLDFNDFLGHLADAVVPEHIYGGGYRYYLYPWLTSVLVWADQVPPYLAGMRLSLAANGLLPVVAWFLGRLVAPRPVALAGALGVVHLPVLLVGLGHPSDYTLGTCLQGLSLALAVLALQVAHPLLFWALGTALALFMGATSKALVILVWVLPCAVAGLPWRRPVRAGVGALGLLVPLAAMWLAYNQAENRPRPLEFNLYQVQRHYAATQGAQVRPSHFGWPEDSLPDDQGTWRPGRWTALTGLPGTLRVMATTPPGYPPLSNRMPGIRNGLETSLGAPIQAVLLLALLGCLAPLLKARGSGSGWARPILATLLLGVAMGGSLVGATRLPFQARFFQPVMVFLPVLALAGAALPFRALARGRGEGAWWAVPVVAVLLLLPGAGPWSTSEAQDRVQVAQGSARTLLSVKELEALVGPQDVVVDLTQSAQAVALYLNRSRVAMGAFRDRQPPITVAASPGAHRRFLFLCTALHPCDESPWWLQVEAELASDTRFRPFRPGIWEDLAPQEPLVILSSFLPPPPRPLGTPGPPSLPAPP